MEAPKSLSPSPIHLLETQRCVPRRVSAPQRNVYGLGCRLCMLCAPLLCLTLQQGLLGFHLIGWVLPKANQTAGAEAQHKPESLLTPFHGNFNIFALQCSYPEQNVLVVRSQLCTQLNKTTRWEVDSAKPPLGQRGVNLSPPLLVQHSMWTTQHRCTVSVLISPQKLGSFDRCALLRSGECADWTNKHYSSRSKDSWSFGPRPTNRPTASRE